MISRSIELLRRNVARRLVDARRRPGHDRRSRLAVDNLESRIVPSAPPPPPGFTSTLFTFTDSNQQLISSTGTPTITATLVVSGAGTYLHDMDLTTFIKHTFSADLDVTLTSPAGTSVTITTDNAGVNDDVYNGTLWDDDADPANAAPFSGDTFAASNMVTDTVYTNLTTKTTLTPEEPLGAFIGEDPNGTWTLTISDDLGGDGGSLDQWKLEVTTLNGNASNAPKQVFSNTTPQPIGPAAGFITSTISVSGAPTYLKNLLLDTVIDHTSNGQLDITLTSPAGTIVTITSDNGGTFDNAFNGTRWDDDADPGNPAPYASPLGSSNLATETVYTNLVTKARLAPEEPLAAFIGEDPNGTWTLTVSDDAASDGGNLTSWGLTVRGAAPFGTPTATATAPNISTAQNGQTTNTITVVYADNTAIDVNTVINNNNAIRVTGPGGFNALATYAGINLNTNGTPRTATYTIAAPGGAWNDADNGTYTVSMEPGQVKDTDGNAILADELTTFRVGIFVVNNADDAGAGSLRNVLTATNAAPGTDLILFDPSFFSTARTISLLTALPVISESAILTGPGANLLTVRRDPAAGTNFRIFDSTAASLSISGLTATGGNPTGDGGALNALGSAPIISLDNVIFTSNTATTEGGGIYVNSGGFLSVRNSTISGNTAGTDGGAFYFFSGGGLLVENSTLTNNRANGTTGGGAFYFFGTASASPPAGFTASTLVIRNSTIDNNVSASNGGGIVLPAFTGTLLIENSTIAGNTAGTSGGGIAQTSGAGSIRVANSTISGNTANGVAANTGGGGIGRISATAGTVTVINSIVSGNANANAPDILSSATTTTDVNFSAVGSNTGFTLSGTSGDNLPFGSNLMLGTLADNGGPTRTIAPQVGSPVINVGSDAGTSATLTTDQRLGTLVRKFGQVDIGSFEVQPPTVTINQASGQADPTNASPILFNVAFNAPVTGFDGSDISFTGSTNGGTLSANVSGSGSNYVVSVTGMTGTGTVVASIPANRAVDGSGTGNVASTSTDNVVLYDGDAPTVTINQAAGQADPTNAAPISFSVVFSEPVVGFTAGDVDLSASTVGGTLVANVAGSGANYTVTVTGMTGVGNVSASIPGSAATDPAGNNSAASTSSDNSVFFDNVLPTVTINQSAGQPDLTDAAPIVFDVVFSEPVTGFDGSDIDFSGSTIGGTLSAFVSGAGTTYTVSVTGMNGEGTLLASIPAGAATDAAGNANSASTSTDNSVDFDNVNPTVTIEQGFGQADPTNGAPITFDVFFHEFVTGFDASDISFTGSTVSGTLVASVLGAGASYTVSVTGMSGEGTVVASIPAGAAFDTLNHSSAASTSLDNSVLFDAIAPTVTINRAGGQADPTNTAPIVFAVQFSEPVSGFTGSDISFAGSTAGGALSALVSGSGANYTVTVSGMTSDGEVVAAVVAGAAVDAANNANTASTSTDNSVTYDTTKPNVTINKAGAQADPTNASPIAFTVVFSQAVTGFTAADVDLSGSTVGGTLVANVSGSGTTYTVAVTGMSGVGDVVATIPAGAASDLAGNTSNASTSTDNVVAFDDVAPTVTINQAATQPDLTNASPIVFEVHFSEPVFGFTGADVSFAGSTVGGTLTAIVTGSGDHYMVEVSGMFGAGTVVASIPAGGATDAAGNGNVASTSTDNLVNFNNIGKLQFNQTGVGVTENIGGVIFTVSRVDGDDGPVSIDYATAAGTAHDGTDYTGTAGTLNWADGDSADKTFTVLIIDDAANEGAESLTVNLSNPTGGAGLGQATQSLKIAPSDPLGPGKFLDQDGDKVTVKLTGAGQLGFYLTDWDGDGKGPIELIELTNTDPLKSQVIVSVAKAKTTADGGRIGLGAVLGSGVKKINARLADLNMEGINLNGYLGGLIIGNVQNGADIVALGTPTQKTTINAGVIGDGTDIQVESSISNLTATRVGLGMIHAPTIGTMLIKGKAATKTTPAIPGDLASDMHLTGAGLTGKRVALTRLTVTGSVLDGVDITAPSIGTIIVKKDLRGDINATGTALPVGVAALGTLTVTGAIDGSAINSAGNVGKVQAGSFLNSTLYAGYSGPDDGTGTFNFPATITSFKVTGKTDAFANANVIATALTTVSLASVNSNNGLDKFGFIADGSIGSLKVLGLQAFTFDPFNLNPQGFGDFEVKVLP